jgi:hypothetical protein
VPEEATTWPDSSETRCMAMVVEPISQAMPQASLCRPGHSAIMLAWPVSSSLWIAAVTFHLPLRRMAWTCGNKILVDEDVAEAPVVFHRRLEAVEIAERLVHVGFLDLDIAELDGGLALEDAGVGGLADDLGVDLHILRDVDDEIALHRSPSRTAAGRASARAFRRIAVP